MNSLDRMQPYKPRAFCFDELRVQNFTGSRARADFHELRYWPAAKRSRRPAGASKFSKANPGRVSWFYFAAKLLWRLGNPVGPRTTISAPCHHHVLFSLPRLPSPSPFARGRAIVLMKRGSGTSTAALTVLIGSVAVAKKLNEKSPSAVGYTRVFDLVGPNLRDYHSVRSWAARSSYGRKDHQS